MQIAVAIFLIFIQDKIKCVAELNYPNVSSLPKVSITLGCEVGSTVCNSLILANTGHLPALYNFEILADNIASTSSPSDLMRYRQVNNSMQETIQSGFMSLVLDQLTMRTGK